MRFCKIKIVGLLVVLSIIGVSGAAFAAYVWNHHTKINVRSAPVAEPSIGVSGQFNGMLPGDRRPLSVTIGNKNTFPVRVTDLSGGSAATKSGCSAYAVKVLPLPTSDPHPVVPAKATRTIVVQVEMQQWADVKCGGQEFTIDMNSTIVPA